jgi:hypothetical protein
LVLLARSVYAITITAEAMIPETRRGSGTKKAADPGPAFAGTPVATALQPTLEPVREPVREPEGEPEREPEGEPEGDPEGEPEGEPVAQPAAKPEAASQPAPQQEPEGGVASQQPPLSPQPVVVVQEQQSA